ncbi:hypothetical protein L1987_09135 [Smallanthus sonchifolius]|uniref:Uncharacterized protein n=1 Tax=Smallanthus sonchifolius TaxID=185202 RepID=A0ACB9JN45_9ASTR|nr:hypothetical protein L1987_09135 [Smallanthus sonchifolius]
MSLLGYTCPTIIPAIAIIGKQCRRGQEGGDERRKLTFQNYFGLFQSQTCPGSSIFVALNHPNSPPTLTPADCEHGALNVKIELPIYSVPERREIGGTILTKI